MISGCPSESAEREATHIMAPILQLVLVRVLKAYVGEAVLVSELALLHPVGLEDVDEDNLEQTADDDEHGVNERQFGVESNEGQSFLLCGWG